MASLLSYFIVSCGYFGYKSWLTCCCRRCLSPLLHGHRSTQYFGITCKTVCDFGLCWLHTDWITTGDWDVLKGTQKASVRCIKSWVQVQRQPKVTNFSLTSKYLILCFPLPKRAPRTINTYHVCTFRHIPVFYIGTKAFLCCPLHPWRITNS